MFWRRPIGSRPCPSDSHCPVAEPLAGLSLSRALFRDGGCLASIRVSLQSRGGPAFELSSCVSSFHYLGSVTVYG